METIIHEGVKVQSHTDPLAFKITASMFEGSLSECIVLGDYSHEFLEASIAETTLPVSSSF